MVLAPFAGTAFCAVGDARRHRRRKIKTIIYMAFTRQRPRLARYSASRAALKTLAPSRLFIGGVNCRAAARQAAIFLCLLRAFAPSREEKIPSVASRHCREAKKSPGPVGVVYQRAPGLKKGLAARYFPTLLSVVSSPLGSLTAVFEMGTGVTSPPKPPVQDGRKPAVVVELEEASCCLEPSAVRAVVSDSPLFFPPGLRLLRGGVPAGKAAKPHGLSELVR